ncbi:MAG: menaquinone-specific isochorismate synthase [Chloroflexota bacterium]|jgi:isochorismate synthase|nr:menaquinone-specific isochorismate synthase [Chloroflexota bacterium]
MTVTDRSGTATDGPTGPLAGDIAAALEPLIDRATTRRRRTLVSATVPVAWCDPVALFGAARALDEEAAIWLQQETGFGLVAIGSAWTVEATGFDRFRRVASTWSEIVVDALVRAPAGVSGTGPLLLGGFGFGAESARSLTWSGFEAARLDLPSLLLTVTAGSTWLTASVVVDPDGGAADVTAAGSRQIAQRWGALVAGATQPVPLVPASAELRIAGQVPEAREWQATVARFAGAVGRGRLDKVVLARRVDLQADGPIDVPAAIRRLEAAAPESTIFAVGRGTRTFLGATPELLVRSEGREFHTVAMAGSIRRGADAEEDERLARELLASEKDREEQAIVVEMLRETLTPVTDRLEIARRPSVVRLRHIQHLATEVRGRLRDPAGIVGLVERLHPTPAVGGAPRELALELIAEGEPLERGWYAGPLGWLDRRGDGEFVVAIRSGVVEGGTVSLFAGCGIVADSDPEREWEESLIKLRALATALGSLRP